MKNSVLYCLLVLLACASCKSTKTQESANNSNIKTSGSPAPHTELITMEKGACHGTCPIYTLVIYNDGIAEMNGRRFCGKIGPHTTQLSNIELNLLQQKISMLDMATYPEKIESMIPDFPSTKITCYDSEQKSKSVWWRNGAPDELTEMSVMLDKFRTDLDWKVDTNASIPAGAIKNQFNVQLNQGVVASDFSKTFRDYDLTPVKEISPESGYWLFEFDTEKISSYEMLNLLNNSDKTRHVEFNRVIEQRN